MSQSELAQRSGVSASVLSRVERGDADVGAQQTLFEKVGDALGFGLPFFKSRCPRLGALGDVHFRKKRSTSASLTRRACAELNICGYVGAALRELADVPDPEFYLTAHRTRDFEGANPAALAAFSLRKEWMVPPGPVLNLVDLVEGAGVWVFSYDLGEDVQGLSFWPDRHPPTIVVNSKMPGDRARWTVAHELGHLALHAIERDPDAMEVEANMFAAEFLMPERDIQESLRGLSIRKLRDLKAEWHVALQALVLRARDLKLVGEYQVKTFYRELSKRGLRKNEPGYFPPELVRQVPMSLREVASTFDDQVEGFAATLGLSNDDVRRLIPQEGAYVENQLPPTDPELLSELRRRFQNRRQ